MVLYKVKVQTGDRLKAGTDATVTIKITGNAGETDAIPLGMYFHNDFGRNANSEYDVEGPDVGDVLMITLAQSVGILTYSADWFVSQVTITKSPNKNNVVYKFPVYRWVITELVVFEGKALLPFNKQNKLVTEQRKREVENNQKLFKWGTDPSYVTDLPGFIDAATPKDLPKDVQFSDEASYALFNTGRESFFNLVLGYIFGHWQKWDSFADFRKVFTPVIGEVPPAADKWQDDVWYGRQFLNGCNPDMIVRCTGLPEKFPVTNEMVGNLLDRGTTLKQNIEGGHTYMVDYEILDGIPGYAKDKDVRHLAASMGLFFVRNDGNIVPIAIQLHQIPGEGNPIFTPNDSEYDWIAAKLWLRNADTQVHQMITHLLRCHLMMEPIAVAAWRQFPSLHPIRKLLHPHIKGVLAINALGRQKLISPGGVADKVLAVGGGGHVTLMQRHYRRITWESYDLPNQLKRRGVHDDDKLPKFYYRDDALQLWKAIRDFVKEIIEIYYKSDEDVVKDKELQNWAEDLHKYGYPTTTDEAGKHEKGFPNSFEKREILVDYLTRAIFTSSCQHAAVNFSQLDSYGFHPNAPSLMRQPAPVKKGCSTLLNILASLATKDQSTLMLMVVKELVTIYPNEKFLGDYSENMFTETSATDAIAKLRVQLTEIANNVKVRNSTLEVPYNYLTPGRVPNSIAI